MASDNHTNGNAARTIPLLINNEPHHTSTTFEVRNPSTNSFLHHASSASTKETTLALSSAQSAQSTWRAVKPARKRDIFLRAATLLSSRTEELSRLFIEETGCSSEWAGFNIFLAAEILKDVGGRILSGCLDGSIPVVAEEGKSAMVWKEPYGVVLAIAPWNAAFILGVRSVAFPLAAGNTVILKAPEMSPGCSNAFVSILHEAGLPPGALNLIAHQPSDAAEVTKQLIESPIIKKINFTGSTGVGRIIAELAGRNLKPVLLELGGKAGVIVWEDADLELAAAKAAIGAFNGSGQVCMSTERIVVHENVVEEFIPHLKKAVQTFIPGLVTLINAAAVQKNKKLVKDALEKGATILYGSPDNDPGEGARMGPVVLKDVKKDMDIYYTESFGPTVSLITVSTEEEALEVVNDTEYGLTSAVFTRDLQRGLRFAKGIEAGAVHINDMTIHDETALPHGGMKASGYGRFGASGLEEWVRTKTVTYKD